MIKNDSKDIYNVQNIEYFIICYSSELYIRQNIILVSTKY